LKIEASGFLHCQANIATGSRQKLALDIVLKIGSVAEGVKVTAGSEVLHTTDASVGEVVEPTSIRELPLNAVC